MCGGGGGGRRSWGSGPPSFRGSQILIKRGKNVEHHILVVPEVLYLPRAATPNNYSINLEMPSYLSG